MKDKKKKERRTYAVYPMWGKLYDTLGSVIDSISKYISFASVFRTTEEYINFGLEFHGHVRAFFLLLEPHMPTFKAKQLDEKLIESHNKLIKARDDIYRRGQIMDDNNRIPQELITVTKQALPQIFRLLYKEMNEAKMGIPTWGEDERDYVEQDQFRTPTD